MAGLVVIGAIWSFRGQVTPEDDLVDFDSIEVVSTTTEPPLEGDLSTGWVAIDLPGTGEIVEVVDTRFGLFAVGRNAAGTSMWKSADGIVWSLLPDTETVFGDAEVNALIETERGVVAVGAWIDVSVESRSDWGFLDERRNPAVWVSADGVKWDRISDERIERSTAGGMEPDDDEALLGAMNDVLLWEDRLVASGWSSSGEHQGAIWVSDLDGMHWKPASGGLDGGGTRFTEVEALSVLGDGLVAVGTVLSRPTLWTSPNAMTWTSVDPVVTLGTHRNDIPVGVANHEAGLISVGGHRLIDPNGYQSFDPGYGIVWVSRDGTEWVRLVPEELEGVFLEDVVVADPWLIVAGNSVPEAGFSSDPAVWYSTRGADWKRVDLRVEGYEWGESSINALVRGGPGLIAGGMVQGLPELWVWAASGLIEPDPAAFSRPAPGGWTLTTELDSEFRAYSVRVVFDEYVAFDDGLVWRSDDWVTWETETLQEAGLAAGSWYSEPVTIDKTAYTIDESGRLWSSTDERHWARFGDRQFSGWIDGPFPGPGGDLLLVEHPENESQSGHLWRLTNGENWSEIPVPDVEWIADVGVVNDRLVIIGWSSLGGPTLLVSTGAGGWEEPDLGDFDDLSGDLVEINGRLFLTAIDHFGEPLVSRVLSSDDGSHWEPTAQEIAGWAGQMVPFGGGVAMLVEQGYGQPRQVVWVSEDGEVWTELGPVPAFRDSWADIAPSNDGTMRVFVRSENRSSLWEWVPPEDG